MQVPKLQTSLFCLADTRRPVHAGALPAGALPAPSRAILLRQWEKLRPSDGRVRGHGARARSWAVPTPHTQSLTERGNQLPLEVSPAAQPVLCPGHCHLPRGRGPRLDTSAERRHGGDPRPAEVCLPPTRGPAAPSLRGREKRAPRAGARPAGRRRRADRGQEGPVSQTALGTCREPGVLQIEAGTHEGERGGLLRAFPLAVSTAARLPPRPSCTPPGQIKFPVFPARWLPAGVRDTKGPASPG